MRGQNAPCRFAALGLALALLCTALSGMQEPLPDEIQRTDLLTFAQGAIFLRQTGLTSGSAGTALRAIDGDPRIIGLTSDGAGPVEFTYQLPALTTFDRFAIPNVIERPGNVTFIHSVTVSGSAWSPEEGYVELARFELEAHDERGQETELQVANSPAVRWVKVHFEGGILIEEGHEGRTNLNFSELVGNGTQEPMELSDAFDGLWEMRLAERTDLQGRPFLLRQEGSSISGCYGDWTIRGTVNGRIAKATGLDPREREVALVLVADEQGVIRAGVSENRSVFGARVAITVADLEPPACAEVQEPVKACGTHVYVNFDVNSATIRPESMRVLEDTFRRLQEENASQVEIIGHTSTEGSVDHNQQLSERRAEAVAQDMISRGRDAASVRWTGAGEERPLIRDDSNENARELNRRVEIVCK